MSKRTLILLAAALLLIAAAVYSAFCDNKVIVEPEAEPEPEPEAEPEAEPEPEVSNEPNVINADACIVSAMPEPIIKKSSKKVREDVNEI
jgi:hypothetical protein